MYIHLLYVRRDQTPHHFTISPYISQSIPPHIIPHHSTSSSSLNFEKKMFFFKISNIALLPILLILYLTAPAVISSDCPSPLSLSICDGNAVPFPKLTVLKKLKRRGRSRCLNDSDKKLEPCCTLYKDCRDVCGATKDLCVSAFESCWTDKQKLPAQFRTETCVSWIENQNRVCDCVSRSSIREMRRDAIKMLDHDILAYVSPSLSLSLAHTL